MSKSCSFPPFLYCSFPLQTTTCQQNLTAHAVSPCNKGNQIILLSCPAHICFCTTTPVSRLLIKKNILAMRNRSAAWHLFYLCNLSETAQHCNESNKHLLCASVHIRDSKSCNVVQNLAEWIQRNLTRPSFRHLNETF